MKVLNCLILLLVVKSNAAVAGRKFNSYILLDAQIESANTTIESITNNLSEIFELIGKAILWQGCGLEKHLKNAYTPT